MNPIRTSLKILQSLGTPNQTTVFSSRKSSFSNVSSEALYGELDQNQDPKSSSSEIINVPAKASIGQNDVAAVPTFKWILIFTIVLTVLSLLGAGFVAFQPEPNELQKSLFSVLTDIAKMSTTAMISLLAGKSIN
jgi:hypothetical protein